MAFFLLENLDSKTVIGSRALVVQAETAADARVAASAHFDGDSGWAGATATALSASALTDSAAMLGWKFDIDITGGSVVADPIQVSYTGAGTDDLAAVAAALVTALNAHAEIAGAAFSAPNLTVAQTTDGIGDAKVIVKITPPSGYGDLSPVLVASITDEGAAGAALTVAFVADTESVPKVMAAVQA